MGLKPADQCSPHSFILLLRYVALVAHPPKIGKRPRLGVGRLFRKEPSATIPYDDAKHHRRGKNCRKPCKQQKIWTCRQADPRNGYVSGRHRNPLSAHSIIEALRATINRRVRSPTHDLAFLARPEIPGYPSLMHGPETGTGNIPPRSEPTKNLDPGVQNPIRAPAPSKAGAPERWYAALSPYCRTGSPAGPRAARAVFRHCW